MKSENADPDWFSTWEAQRDKAKDKKNKGKAFYFYAGADGIVTAYTGGNPRGWLLTDRPSTSGSENNIPPGAGGYIYDYWDYEQGKTFGAGYGLTSLNSSVQQRFGCLAEWRWPARGKATDEDPDPPATTGYSIIKTDTETNLKESDRMLTGSSGGGDSVNSGESCKGFPSISMFNLSDMTKGYKYHDISTAIPSGESLTAGADDSSSTPWS